MALVITNIGKITGINCGVDGNLNDYFESFNVEGIGKVDISMSQLYDSETEDTNQYEIIDWALSKVGTTISIKGLRPTKAYACDEVSFD